MINFQHFPKSHKAPQILLDIIKAFEKQAGKIDSNESNADSDEILATLRVDLEKIGFKVETSKKKDGKIAVPVLYGLNNKPEKQFFADGYHPEHKVVLEVEGAAAVANNRFLKDLFEACVMGSVDHCVIAVRNRNFTSNNAKDFETVVKFIETIFVSQRLNLPLTSVMIIGY